ncbi:MAG: putative lipid II flippase FtsW [Candidatus Nealsonbacteria bacterium]|nr:putative lipid II flippase FtsW [Candidatus Nealsonbacteria bacterium]
MRGTKNGRPDYILALITTILLLLGIIVLASVSTAISQQKFGSPYFYLIRHLLVGLAPGILLGFIAYKVPLAFWEKRAPFFLLISLFLTALVFFPKIGITLGGASRWLNLGFTSLQPSEFLKLTFILYLAAWLPQTAQKNKKNYSKILTAFLVILGLVALLLILQPNVSTLGIIAACGILIYFLSGSPWKYNLMIFSGALAVLAVLIKIAPYRFERILVFLRPDTDPMGMSYQIKQALIAVGSGGFWGRGLGMSIQKLGFLPEPMADSIFAVFSEETGFMGALVLILLFLIFTYRGMKIAKETIGFCKLASFGITCWIIIQAFVNIGAMLAITPLTGIPMPFISYGGSAIIAELIGVGILLNISRNYT